jgi:RHS repeat-associated protein
MVAINYLWNPINDNIVREFDDAGNTVAEYTTEPDLYGNVISQYRDGQTGHLHFDGQGSTTELTNDTGTVTDTIRYSAFGELVNRTGPTAIPLCFVGENGYYAEVTTRQYYIRQRSLIAQEGRWLSLDSPSDVSTRSHGPLHEHYVYVNNSPAVSADPSGRTNPPPRPRFPNPRRNQCMVILDCVNAALIGYHCGIAIKWWEGGKLETMSYHALGIYARGPGCKVEPATASKYGIELVGYFPKALCGCISRAVGAFNAGIATVHASYRHCPN